MNLRSAIVCVVLLFLSPSLAYAQETTEQPEAPALSAAHVEMGRDVLDAILVDGGVFSDFVPMAFNMAAPYFRALFQNTQFFASLPPDRQQALLAYLDNIAIPGAEEAMIAAPMLLTRFAPRMAAMFSEDELAGIAEFSRTPLGAEIIRESMASGITGFPPDLSPEHIAAAEAFDRTESGRAWLKHKEEFGELMYDIGRATTSAPNVVARLQRDLCAIASPDCPAAWRNQT